MTYKSKLTLFVDLRKVREIAEENGKSPAGHLKAIYEAVRLDFYWKEATFDCVSFDEVAVDKIEMEFRDPFKLLDFFRGDAWRKYLRDVVGDPTELLKRELDNGDGEEGSDE